jgi:hypothetical protein
MLLSTHIYMYKRPTKLFISTKISTRQSIKWKFWVSSKKVTNFNLYTGKNAKQLSPRVVGFHESGV